MPLISVKSSFFPADEAAFVVAGDFSAEAVLAACGAVEEVDEAEVAFGFGVGAAEDEDLGQVAISASARSMSSRRFLSSRRALSKASAAAPIATRYHTLGLKTLDMSLPSHQTVQQPLVDQEIEWP
jgi:hypothetical protein